MAGPRDLPDWVAATQPNLQLNTVSFQNVAPGSLQVIGLGFVPSIYVLYGWSLSWTTRGGVLGGASNELVLYVGDTSGNTYPIFDCLAVEGMQGTSDIILPALFVPPFLTPTPTWRTLLDVNSVVGAANVDIEGMLIFG